MNLCQSIQVVNLKRVLDMKLEAVQSKMARVALGITGKQLAELAGVSLDTINRLEAGEELKPRTVAAIRAALESAGVEFTNGEGPGVRLRKASQGTEGLGK
jgi:transcriptional regulator with XRE-family HTH domain